MNDSLSRMTADEQKAVKTTAFGLARNLSSAGLFQYIDMGKSFWPVRLDIQ